MPRIRSIKPEVRSDRTLARASRDARLTFVYLWLEADDEGWFRATPKSLAGSLYPHDADVDEAALVRWLDELASIGRIELFDTADGPLGHIVNFLKHQKIDHPSQSFLAKVSREPRESLARPSRRESMSLESRSPESSSPQPPTPPAAVPPAGTEKPRRKNIPVTQDHPIFMQAWDQYPRRSGSNPRLAALRQWLARVASGEDPQVMLAGTLGYKRWAISEDKVGTEFIQRGSTFYGRDKPYLDFVPKAPPKPRPVPPALELAADPPRSPEEQERIRAEQAEAMERVRQIARESRAAAGAT